VKKYLPEDDTMPELLSEDDFTDRFTDKIREYDLAPSAKEPLVLELHYGGDEPVLTISLKTAYQQYMEQPSRLDEVIEPFVRDLGWTVQMPKFSAKDIYETTLPTLRNFMVTPPTADEVDMEPSSSRKGPIVFEDLLRSATEYIAIQFYLPQPGNLVALRRGDIIPCSPDSKVISKLAFNNLAMAVQKNGLTATPLKFESLTIHSWLIGLGAGLLPQQVPAMICVPEIISSLEDSLKATTGLTAILPSRDQLIVSIDCEDTAVCELGVLARQLWQRAPEKLSSFVWCFKDGALTGVQAVELEEESLN
jgi:hypothetical protein